MLSSGCGGGLYTYLSYICTYLSYGSQELYASHPFIEAETRLAGKVVEMGNQSLHDIFEAWVAALRVYAVHVLGDVIDCEVFEDGDGGGVCAGGCHTAGC